VDENRLLNTAIEVAVRAHDGDVDRIGDPYILHPLTVMLSLESAEERIVGVLHDVPEDTATTLDDLIGYGFPPEIIEALDAITHREGESDIDYWLRVKANPLALRVKYADIAHNTSPARVNRLAPDVRERLRVKYQRALAVLMNGLVVTAPKSSVDDDAAY